MDLSVQDQGHHAAEPGPPGGRRVLCLQAGKFGKHLVHVLAEILSLPGITGGIHPRSTSESLYFQTRVIGEAVASKMLEDIFSLLKRVLLKGKAGLGNVLRQTVVCGGEKFESFPEDFGSLTEFPAVAGSENDFCDFHECKYPKNKGKIHRNG